MSFLRIAIIALGSLCTLLPLAGEILLKPDRTPVSYAGKFSNARVNLPPYRAKRIEFRGAWVATVENLDIGTCKSAAEFQAAYLAIVNNLKKANFNAILFQVRPTCDAFFPSRFNPWSRWMTGREGGNFGDFDPLEFMVREAHRRGLAFHAWLNPYRVIGNTRLSKNEYLKTLDQRNFARQHPELVLSSPTGKGNLLFLDPGEPEVIKHITQVVEEIVDNYQVDGIVFDDYFYPYHEIGDIDSRSFAKYNYQKLSLADWRRNNVTAVIRAVRGVIDRANLQRQRKVVFGISPFGIWANKASHPDGSLTGGKQSYFAQYADTRKWVREKLIDYISPQLYWQFNHNVAAYAALVDWWCETVRGTGVRLFISQSASRIGSSADWSAEEAVNQLRYNCGRPEVSGTIYYAYRHIFKPGNPVQAEGAARIKRMWRSPAGVPAFPTLQRRR